MKKRWVALIAFASLAIGLVSASWFWLDFNAQFMNHSNLLKTEADIVMRVAALEHIRAGRIAEATNLLEILLDGDLISAGVLARDGKQLSANTNRAMAKEMKARETSGYVPPDESVRAAVQEAFRLIRPSSTEVDAQRLRLDRAQPRSEPVVEQARIRGPCK